MKRIVGLFQKEANMPTAIAFIPHKQRLLAHRVDYVKAFNDALDYPFQAEDGRDLAPIQQKLTEKCKEYSGLPYWSFTDCGTDSLQIAVELVTKVGDTVLVPAYGWRAFSNAPIILGRKVEFCDIDATGNISLEQLELCIKEVKPTAVIIVHNFGVIVDVSKIFNLCKEYNVKIIEDAAPSFYMGEPTSYKPGHSSDVVCYSFDFTKFPGCLGSGGGLATRHVELADTIHEIQAHGTNRAKQVVGIGTKSFLDNTSCSVLLKEFELFEIHKYRDRRRYIAKWYKENLPFKSIPGENYIWERYSMYVEEAQVQGVLDKLHSINCLARTMFKQPLNTYSFYENKKYLPAVDKFSKNLVHIPCHQYLTDKDLHRIKNALEEL
jgi:UDP-2-acetamido-2-deoxy-ribo-hexuluronate aminotransferase